MTGAIDQKGNVLPVGGVNEKIEGFFEACRDTDFTGSQGVIIPNANAGDLMLREDVVEAAHDGRFHVYAVKSVFQALELLTGMRAGVPVTAEANAGGSLLELAVERARDYWRMVSSEAGAGHEARRSPDEDTSERTKATDPRSQGNGPDLSLD